MHVHREQCGGGVGIFLIQGAAGAKWCGEVFATWYVLGGGGGVLVCVCVGECVCVYEGVYKGVYITMYALHHSLHVLSHQVLCPSMSKRHWRSSSLCSRATLKRALRL